MGRLEHLAQAMHVSALGRALRRAGAWPGTLVLTYHRLGDARLAPGDQEVFSATPQAFAAQLALLQREAEVVDVAAVLHPPRRRGRRVLITFDDGYRDNHTHALPALRDAGLPAVFFVATGFLDAPRWPWWDEIAWMVRRGGGDPLLVAGAIDRYKTLAPGPAAAFLDEVAERTGSGRRPPDGAAAEWMTWDMVRELRDAGLAVGGHTVDHPVLARLDVDQQAAQIDGCARRLRDEVGASLRWFSYPVGTPAAYDATTRELLDRAGVEAAFTFSGGYVAPSAVIDRLLVPRTSVGWRMSHARFAAVVTAPPVYARW